MYKIHQSNDGIVLYKDGKIYSEFADWEDMAGCLLADIDFAEHLYGEPIWAELALAKRAYPELRMGQLIANAIDVQRQKYNLPLDSTDIVYAPDEALIEGLRLLFERKLVAHESLCSKTNEKTD